MSLTSVIGWKTKESFLSFDDKVFGNIT